MVKSPQTVIEWLNLLPQPYKIRAISNTNPEHFQSSANNMLTALGSAFNWGSTVQGFEYWAKIARSFNDNPNTSFEELSNLVKNWGETKGINNFANQFIKTIEELGELGRAVLTNDIDEERDAFGDVLVCLIILANIRNQNLVSCLHEAYNVIKDRTGKTTESGTFIKSEDNVSEKI
jgi:NTP pyrophosphatase (non-canonical NTP hydrolase)